MASNVATIIQGLECSLCFNLLEEPKLLSCTHSFCEKCIQHLHNSQGIGTELLCPLCRRITLIHSKDVSSLKTNLPLKDLVGDVKTTRKICTVCDPVAKSPAVYYCQECYEYMCDACLEGHDGFRKNASHLVVSMDDIKSGKVKVKKICHKHPGEERLWVCTSCRVSICFRCRMLHHNGSDHVVQEVDDFKNNIKDEIDSLVKRGMKKVERIQAYTKIVREQTLEVGAIIAQRETDIKKEFDKKLLLLNSEKNALLDQCREQKMKLTAELSKQNGDELISSLNSTCELVGNGVRALLEAEALVVHSNLCRELQDMVDRGDPEISKLKQVTNQAEGFTFSPCKLDDGHYLGVINTKDWILETVVDLNTSKMCPCTMAPTKYGKMLVGYDDSCIKEFTVSGSHKTVLKDVKMQGVSALSDGRYVVRDWDQRISVYSSDWKKLDITEFAMGYSFDSGGIDVDKYNNIYVGYYHDKMIRVFTPEAEGGAPIREIPCHGYSPFVICTMNHSNMLVVKNASTVRVIDQQGTVKHALTKKDLSAVPAVLHDDNILIGWWKGGLVSIDLYTNQLRHVRTVISGLESKSKSWNLREFSSGEIAFCTRTKFCVLRNS